MALGGGDRGSLIRSATTVAVVLVVALFLFVTRRVG